MRWRQQEALDQEGNDRNANAVRVALEIPQPKCSEIYYSVCGSIDQHNRHRQDTLKIETKIETKSWDKRVVTTSLFGMYCVDAWLMYKGCTTDAINVNPKLKQQDFYCALAEELIEVRYSPRRPPGGVSRTPLDAVDISSTIPVLKHVTQRKRTQDGTCTNNRSQGRCRVCYKGRPTTVCSLCEDNNKLPLYFCSPWTGRDCFNVHKIDTHQ